MRWFSRILQLVCLAQCASNFFASLQRPRPSLCSATADSRCSIACSVGPCCTSRMPAYPLEPQFTAPMEDDDLPLPPRNDVLISWISSIGMPLKELVKIATDKDTGELFYPKGSSARRTLQRQQETICRCGGPCKLPADYDPRDDFLEDNDAYDQYI